MIDQPQIGQQIQQLLNSQGPQDATKFNSNLLDDFDYSDEESSPKIQTNGGNVGAVDRTEIPPQLLDSLSMIMSTERGIQQLRQSGHVTESQIQQLQMLLSARQQQSVPPYMSHNQISPKVNNYNVVVPAQTTGLEHSNAHMHYEQGHPSIDISQPPPISGGHINPWAQLQNHEMLGQTSQHAPLIDISMDAGREDNMSDIVEVIDDRDGGWNERGNRGDKTSRRNKEKDRRNRRTGSRSRSRDRERGGKRSRRDRRLVICDFYGLMSRSI